MKIQDIIKIDNKNILVFRYTHRGPVTIEEDRIGEIILGRKVYLLSRDDDLATKLFHDYNIKKLSIIDHRISEILSEVSDLTKQAELLKDKLKSLN